MIFKAKELILLDTSNNTVVAAAKSIEINVKCDTVERTSANNGLYREYITGRKDWNFQISSLVTSSQFSGAKTMVGTTYSVKFSLQGSTAALMSGNAICTQAKITDQKGSIAKGSFVFQGTGALS